MTVQEEVERIRALATVAREVGIQSLQVDTLILVLGPQRAEPYDSAVDDVGRPKYDPRPEDDYDPKLLYGSTADGFDR